MLTNKQEAVTLIKKNCSYVCALPGSGKTFVNTELCYNLLSSSQDLKILDVTFTRTAASEMKARLSKKLPPEMLSRVKISTLDSCIVNMARAYFNHHNIKFKLLIGPEYYLTVMRVVNELNICDMDSALEILDYYLSFPTDIQFENSDHKQIVDTYKDIINSKKIPAFDLKTLGRLLIEKIHANEIAPYPFDIIIIDEFQDTGQIQYEWIKLHGKGFKGKSTIIGIGDDDQALYRFAGSLGHANFINLKNDFIADGYNLDTCFRCAPNILAFAESIIKHNSYRVNKEFNAIKGEHSGTINIHLHSNSIVNDLLPHFAKKPSNISILCRTNMLVNEVELLMVNEHIPYQRLNGKGGLFSDYNVVAYVKLLTSIVLDKNPYSIIDVLGWLHESESKLRFIESYINERNIKRVSQLDIGELLKQGLSTASNVIFSNISRWQKYGKSTEIFRCQKNIISLIADFFPEKRSTKKVFSFADFITQRLKGDTFKERVAGLDAMLNQIMDNNSEIDRSKVTIGTLHASKGLEWDTVWIIDASHDKIPSVMKESIIEAKNNLQMHLEDERRLFYVGTTRAERELNISFSGDLSVFLANADLSLATFYDAENNEIEVNTEDLIS